MEVEALKKHPAFGSFAAIGRACGVGREAVRKWKRVPAEHCESLANASGLTPKDLRPDLPWNFDARKSSRLVKKAA